MYKQTSVVYLLATKRYLFRETEKKTQKIKNPQRDPAQILIADLSSKSQKSCGLVHLYVLCNAHLALYKYLMQTHSSFTNRCTFIKPLITIYIKIRWFLHVSVYDFHQGACN